MFDRTTLLGMAVAGIFFAAPVTRCHADVVSGGNVHLAMFASDDEKRKADPKDADDDEKDGEKKDKHDDADDHHEGKEHGEKEIEQAVPMNMVPQAVLDAVKKEVPSGTITEAELEAKKGKIMYAFDVKDGEMMYDVKITVDGKFFSKKVDDEKDEKDEHDEKPEKKAAPAGKM